MEKNTDKILVELDGDVLTIKVPVSRKPSSTGKSIIIASSGGNQKTGLKVDGKDLYVGLNAYIPA